MDLSYDPTPRDRDAERARLDSILTVAGSGSILQPEPADPAAEMEAALLRAGARDWRAALAWLQYSPRSREVWSDAAVIASHYRANTGRVVAGIERWAAAEQIPPQTVKALLLHLQAAGTAAIDEVSE
jgi:hypothetical protein